MVESSTSENPFHLMVVPGTFSMVTQLALPLRVAAHERSGWAGVAGAVLKKLSQPSLSHSAVPAYSSNMHRRWFISGGTVSGIYSVRLALKSLVTFSR